eukprot:scaffold38372_cov58-Phaeocystis_antarctica.AAC.3
MIPRCKRVAQRLRVHTAPHYSLRHRTPGPHTLHSVAPAESRLRATINGWRRRFERRRVSHAGREQASVPAALHTLLVVPQACTTARPAPHATVNAPGPRPRSAVSPCVKVVSHKLGCGALSASRGCYRRCSPINKRSLRVVYCKFHQTLTTTATYCHKLQTHKKQTQKTTNAIEKYAEAWSFLRSDLILFADGIVAAIQIDVEHGPIVAQIDLKVELQAGMCLRHGFNQGKALFDPQAKLGLIWCVCEEVVDSLVSEGFGASQHHALGP